MQTKSGRHTTGKGHHRGKLPSGLLLLRQKYSLAMRRAMKDVARAHSGELQQAYNMEAQRLGLPPKQMPASATSAVRSKLDATSRPRARKSQ